MVGVDLARTDDIAVVVAVACFGGNHVMHVGTTLENFTHIMAESGSIKGNRREFEPVPAVRHQQVIKYRIWSEQQCRMAIRRNILPQIFHFCSFAGPR